MLGIRLTLCTTEELLGAIQTMVQTNSKGFILSGNVHSFNIAYRNPWFRDFLNQADIVRLDGAGLILGAHILGYRYLPNRITWADFVWDLAAYSEQHGFSLFLLGGQPGIAKRAASCLVDRFPHLRNVGTHHGYFDKTTDHPENEEVIQMISAARPSILIIGFGMPVQEKWLSENRHRLEVPVVLTGGAVFDYVSGAVKRGPRWMTDHGLEWLARLVIQPRRLWKRYLIGNPLFLWRILKERIGCRSR